MSALLFLVLLLSPNEIGSGLRDGMRLVYESGGVAQAPWTYDSVRVVPSGPFDRCVAVVRRGEAERESCARGDTLFERRASGEYAAVRPIGPNMQLEVHTASGNVLHYSTGSVDRRLILERPVDYLPTTIITRNAEGIVTRRLREQYAPSLLTALGGIFEQPITGGGWQIVRDFTLAEIQVPPHRH